MADKDVLDKARCKHCIYFDDGACRYSPPTVHLVTMPIGLTPMALWPPVRPDIDWCSEISITDQTMKQLEAEATHAHQPASN